MATDSDRIRLAVSELLAAIGDDPRRPGLVETPARVAEAFAELFAGVGVDAASVFSTGADADTPATSDPIVLTDIPVRSVCEHHLLPFTGRPLVLGIVNATPDSFSDGGKHLDPAAAIARSEALIEAGADVIDVGGESTRPGAPRVDPQEEQRRVLPIVGELASRGLMVSIDTMNAATARAAIAAGAWIVNDVSGGLADPRMASVIADTDARYIAMHWRGHSTDMESRAVYGDVVDEVRDELAARLDALTAAGIPRERIVLDPGLGFAKTAEHNWALLAGLDRLAELGIPLLVGASRKRFLGALPHPGDGSMEARDLPTAVISALAATAGVWGVRVHDAASTAAALDVVDAIREAAETAVVA